MRRVGLFAVAVLLATSAAAVTINSISPQRMRVHDGENFVAIDGSGFAGSFSANTVTFDGPAGKFTLGPSYVSYTRLIVWVPVAVMNTAGHYQISVSVLDWQTWVTSNSRPFEISGDPSPHLYLPYNPRVETTNPAGAKVTFTINTASGIDGAPVPYTCDHASGETFPVGVTVVSCTATDPRDVMSTTGQFSVTVVLLGTPPPPPPPPPPPVVTLTLPHDIVTEATSAGGAVVTFTAAASNGATVTCAPASGSLFPLGITAVNCSAGSISGNFHVSVIDTTPPAIVSIAATPATLAPPDHKLVPVTVHVVANDIDPTLTTRIYAITANEPISATGSGNTEGDWRITGPLTVELRAERSGSANDRVYTIHVECLDRSGNRETAIVNVTVAHDAATNPVTSEPPPPAKHRGARH